MKKFHIIDLDSRILQVKDKRKRSFLIDPIDKKVTILELIDYFIKENNPSIDEFDNLYEERIAELGYIEAKKRVGIIIPKPRTTIRYSSLIIGPSTILTFNKTENIHLQIYENEVGYELKEIIKNIIKKGEFIKSKTIPKEFVKYLY